MPAPIRILLVTPDLMVSSRVTGLAAGCDASLDTVVRLDAVAADGRYHVAILDLQGVPGDAGDLVSLARERLAAHGPDAGAGPALVAFGPHVAADRLAAARAAGADVVSRGELLGAFATIIGRHRG